MAHCEPGEKSAAALGVTLSWRFEFCGHGSQIDPEPGVITFDVGNALMPGVLDQHHDLELGLSSAELIFKHPEFVTEHLYPDLKEAAQKGVPFQPIIRTHWSPDFDALVSALLVQELVAHGSVPVWAEGLVQIASLIDSGSWRPDISQGEESPALRSVMLMMHAIEASDDAARMERALGYLRKEARALSAALGEEALGADRGSAWFGPACGGWATGDPEAQSIIARLRSDLSRYEAMASQIIRGEVIGLPVRGDSRDKASVSFAQVPAACVIGVDAPVRLLKYWLRAEGAVMTIIPLPYTRVEGRRRVIIALDPTYRDTSGLAPCLEGLGRALEDAEQARRLAIGDPTLLRAGTPRYPWVDHDDPWYTGVGHGYTIVDSPRSGSVLDYERIANLAQDPSGWRP